MENGGFTMENDGFTMENGGFTNKSRIRNYASKIEGAFLGITTGGNRLVFSNLGIPLSRSIINYPE